MANLNAADQTAIGKVLAAEPVLQGLKPASEAVGLDRNTILHAGPAFAKPADITKPILNSAVVALMFEGIAGDFEAAEQMILSGDVFRDPPRTMTSSRRSRLALPPRSCCRKSRMPPDRAAPPTRR